MPSKKPTVLIVFDLPEPHPEGKTFKSYLRESDYRDERHVYQALRELGYPVLVYGLYDDLAAFMTFIREHAPDLVFPMCESFRNQRDFSANVIATLEMLGLKYAGAGPHSLNLCRNKGLSKKLLSFHGIKVPAFTICSEPRSLPNLSDFPFPAIVKPLELEASEGISFKSVVSTPAQARAQVRKLYRKYKTPIIIEQFISGRELYVGVLGNEEAKVLPPQELIFRKRPRGNLNIATYRVKWDKSFRRKLGIGNQKARPLPAKTQTLLKTLCREIYNILDLKGYARFDLRVDEQGDIYFIEANPNPAINRNDDFAMSAKHGGLTYERLIDKIVKLGLAA